MRSKPLMSSAIDELAVHFAYLFLLGREPENEQAVKNGVREGGTINALRESVMSCSEYHSLTTYQAAGRMLRGDFGSLGQLKLDVEAGSDVITLLQTSDPDRYYEMLVQSAKYNKQYSSRYDLKYLSFVGIKNGYYPHHAMFNRIFMLNDMMVSGYRGWVLYMDADCVMVDPEWDISAHLCDLRKDGKIMLLHNVFPPGDDRYQWWDVNDGAFAIDLAANHSRAFISAWVKFYLNLYSADDYRSAKYWYDIVDDQSSFQFLLREMSKYIDIKSELFLSDFQSNKARQVLRGDFGSDTGISADDELLARIERIRQIGDSVWESHKPNLVGT